MMTKQPPMKKNMSTPSCENARRIRSPIAHSKTQSTAWWRHQRPSLVLDATLVAWRRCSCAVDWSEVGYMPIIMNSVSSGFCWLRCSAAHQRWTDDRRVTRSRQHVPRDWIVALVSIRVSSAYEWLSGWWHLWRLACVRWTQSEKEWRWN